MKPMVKAKPIADVTTQSENGDTGKDSRKRCGRRVAVAIVIVLVVALVGIAGGLTAAYILKNQPAIRERVYTVLEDGTDVSVKVATDSKAKLAILTEGKSTIVREYNKGFTVYAVPARDNEIMCFIRLMDNTTSNFSSVQSFVDNSVTVEDKAGTPTVDRIVGEKIKDLTFLSSYAQQACDGHDTYWVTPDDSKRGGITKRSYCCFCIPTLPWGRRRCFCYCIIHKFPFPDPGPDPPYRLESDLVIQPGIQNANLPGK